MNTADRYEKGMVTKARNFVYEGAWKVIKEKNLGDYHKAREDFDRMSFQAKLNCFVFGIRTGLVEPLEMLGTGEKSIPYISNLTGLEEHHFSGLKAEVRRKRCRVKSLQMN